MTRDAPVDLLDRQVPRRFGIMVFLRAIPWSFRAFFPIPDEFWALDVNDDGYSAAVVACQCRRMPVIEVGMMEECVCGRMFLFTGRDVRVANSPKLPISEAVPA